MNPGKLKPVLYPAGHDMLFLFLILFSVLAVAINAAIIEDGGWMFFLFLEERDARPDG